MGSFRSGLLLLTILELTIYLVFADELFQDQYGIRHVWTAWSSWSTCSKSCDGGVMDRKRECVGQYGAQLVRLDRPRCPGNNKEFKICNVQNICPPSHSDDRTSQCAKYNEKHMLRGESMYHWVPYYGGANPCELNCLAKGFNFYYGFGYVADGTRCRKHSRDRCVAGKCMKIGCDGMVGSGAEEDMCRVCDGHNRSCVKWKKVYGNNLPKNYKEKFKYNAIAMIPAGATYINVKDNSKNFLALTDAENSYVLNGNRIIDWPGNITVGGATMQYTRSWDHKETLRAMGPTKEDLHLMVLMNNDDPGIVYEYWVPKAKYAKVKEYDKKLELNALQERTQPEQKTTPQTSPKPTQRSYIPNKLNLPTAIVGQKRRHYNVQKVQTRTGTHVAPPGGYQTYQVQLPPLSNMTRTITSKNHHTKRTGKHIGKNKINQSKSDKTRINKVRGMRKKKGNTTMPAFCRPCKRVKNAKLHYCKSDFVMRARIKSLKSIGQETRYDVQVVETYKNNFSILHREYLWVPYSCRCPKLRTNREYIIMGASVTSLREVRLEIDHLSYVRRYSRKNALRLRKIRMKSKCSKNRKKKV